MSLRRVRQGAEEAQASREFWMALSPEQRVEMLWEMALEEHRRSSDSTQGDPTRVDRSRVRCVRRA
ncbi:MAG: hypothetical protein IT457_07800 [Planctomycetes bacterium]|nr:hypothetical protein [Planctomycetota bacterium]